jgi:hypothetical protein
MSDTHAPILPVYRVAVVRSDSESVHNPARDIVGMLDDRAQWRYRLFSQDTYDALLRSQREFDCAVIGYNATYRSEQLTKLLNESPLEIGMVLLHQIEGRFRLGNDLTIVMAKLDKPRADLKRAVRDPQFEMLLNWPESIAMDQLEADAVCEIKPEPASPWRPVLSVGEERSVLMRSALPRRPPVVACSLLLEPGKPQHQRLLRNLLVFAASGPPDTVVLSPETPAQGALVRKLRLRGGNALEVRDGDGLDFEKWPLRAVTDVVAIGTTAALPGQAEWLERGGRLTHVDLSTGALSTQYQARDVQWVARRWSTWLQTDAARVIDERITTVCAYLRAVKTFDTLLGGKLARFGLEHPEARRTKIQKLLETRLKDGDNNLEDSVGPTAAVLEIDENAGGVLGDARRARIEAWLYERTSVRKDGVVLVRPSTAVEDAVEASRVLRDRQLLESCQPLLDGRVTTATLTRLRLAAVACGAPLAPIPLSQSAHETIIAELHTSVLAASEHLSSLAAYRAFLSADHPALVSDLDAESAPFNDEAITTIAKCGVLSGSPHEQDATAEEVCAEALALASFLSIDTVATTPLSKSDVVPAQLIDGLLVEGLRIRTEYRELAKKSREQARSLFFARTILSIFALAAGAAAGYGASQAALAGVLGEGFVPPVFGALVLGLLGKLLDRFGLSSHWLAKIYDVASGGLASIISMLRPAPNANNGPTPLSPGQSQPSGDPSVASSDSLDT